MAVIYFIVGSVSMHGHEIILFAWNRLIPTPIIDS